MKENRKKITSGDILEMMVRAGLKPESEIEREEITPGNPIISVNGKDVDWHELGSKRRHSKKKKAA